MTAGASDDIRRATELAYRSVSEFGLSAAVGPLAVASMGGDDGALMLRDSGVPLCCATLCCATLCAVLCCAVLCCAVLCCAVVCCAVHDALHDRYCHARYSK